MKNKLETTATGNLIISIAINYKFKDLKVFLLSLNKYFDGDLYLIVKKPINLPKFRFKVFFIKFKPKEYLWNSMNNVRLFVIRDYLLTINKKYNKVLFIDSRDVVFQGDIFEKLSSFKNNLVVFQEDVTIQNCEYNSKWIRATCNADKIDLLMEFNVLCCGSIFGTLDGFVEFLDFACDYMNKLIHLDSGNNYLNIDQGVFNIYCRLFAKDIFIMDNLTGPVLTISYNKRVIMDKEGYIISDSNSRYTVVHQYDRFKWLDAYLHNKYSLNRIICFWS